MTHDFNHTALIERILHDSSALSAVQGEANILVAVQNIGLLFRQLDCMIFDEKRGVSSLQDPVIGPVDAVIIQLQHIPEEIDSLPRLSRAVQTTINLINEGIRERLNITWLQYEEEVRTDDDTGIFEKIL